MKALVPPLSQYPNGPVFLQEETCCFHLGGQEIVLDPMMNVDPSTCKKKKE